MKGTAYCVGVGPGDPELMMPKAVRLIKENDIIAVPGKEARDSVAYKIAVQAVPELAEKEPVPVCMPMLKDKERLEAEHRRGAELLKKYLDQGKNVVYLTLGDPTVYCTFSYLQHVLEAEGYPVVLVSGVPSFCAAAARLNLPLAEWDETLRVVPALHRIGGSLDGEGTYVLMKSASHMKEVKELIRSSGREAAAVIDCGMESEQVCRSLDEIPDDAGYFSLIISKKP
ncbi:MAG: precorrin-2 C(20)-methyltransferase [Firmicutes bacterium]|nr:precorrin-2 C(20)-methyltransferase [Bacillota bacterium]